MPKSPDTLLIPDWTRLQTTHTYLSDWQRNINLSSISQGLIFGDSHTLMSTWLRLVYQVILHTKPMDLHISTNVHSQSYYVVLATASERVRWWLLAGGWKARLPSCCVIDSMVVWLHRRLGCCRHDSVLIMIAYIVVTLALLRPYIICHTRGLNSQPHYDNSHYQLLHSLSYATPLV